MFGDLFQSIGSLITNNLPNIITTGFNAYTQLQASRAKQADYQFQADILQSRSKQEELQAREQSLQLRKKVQADLGRAQAMFANRGILLGSGGTPLKAYEESLMQQGQDIESLMFGAQNNANALLNKANMRRVAGSGARRLGYLEATKSLISGYNALDFGNKEGK